MENNKELIRLEIKKLIDKFYREYPLPPENISDEEWYSVLDVLEAHFLANNIMNEYIHALNIIVRRALYFAQISNADEFTINHVKRALIDLAPFKIGADEIKAIQEEIDERNIKHMK